MTSEVVALVAVIAGTLTVAHRLEQWAEEEAQDRLYRDVVSPALRDPIAWFHTASRAFVRLFDRIYCQPTGKLYGAAWHSVLFCYIAFLVSRLVLWVFKIPKPSTRLMLVTVLLVATGTALAREIVLRIARIARSMPDADFRTVARHHRKDFRNALLLLMTTAYLLIGGTVMIVYGIGISFKNVTALCIGAALVVPIAAAVELLPLDRLRVNPGRAFASSLIAVLVLSCLKPEVAFAYIDSLDIGAFAGVAWKQIPDHLISFVPQQRAPIVGGLSLIAYNLFADMLSLSETRWLLNQSLGRRLPVLLCLLVSDLVLSGAIFLFLPMIAGQDPEVLLEAVLLEGDRAWLGIMFWSSFATSLMFYVFVLSAALVRLVAPLLALVSRLDSTFSFASRPLRAIAVFAVFLEVIGFAVIIVSRVF